MLELVLWELVSLGRRWGEHRSRSISGNPAESPPLLLLTGTKNMKTSSWQQVNYFHSHRPAYLSKSTSPVQPANTCCMSPFSIPRSEDQRMEPDRLTPKFTTEEYTYRKKVHLFSKRTMKGKLHHLKIHHDATEIKTGRYTEWYTPGQQQAPK